MMRDVLNAVYRFLMTAVIRFSVCSVLLCGVCIYGFAGGKTAAGAETVLTLEAGQQFAYAQHLYLQADYRRAVDEYKRFIYFFPEDKRRLKAHFQVGMAHYHMKAYDQALQAFQTIMDDRAVLSEGLTDDTAVDAWFMASECYLKLKRYGVAVLQLRNLITLTADPSIMDRAHIQMAWIFIQSASWQNARFHLKSVRSASAQRYHVPELVRQLTILEDDPDAVISRKSPVLSGFLSIVPGAGYVYCRRYRDALISFVVNSGLMLAACQAFENDNAALGTMITLVETGFYTGNIYGSVTAAHKYNRTQQKAYIEGLKKRCQNEIDIGLMPDFIHKGAMLTFRCRF